jgi:hypothetical protein
MNMKKLFLCLVMTAVLASCSKPYVIVQIADAQLGFTASDKCKAEGREFDENVSYELSYLRKAVAKVNEINPDAQEWYALSKGIYGIPYSAKLTVESVYSHKY